MAPITDDVVETLRDTIRQLESRVHQLESKMGGGDGSPQSRVGQSSIRMILMGPPGAGKIVSACEFLSNLSSAVNRQGNPSTQNTGEVLRLPFGMHSPTVVVSELIEMYRQQGTCFGRK